MAINLLARDCFYHHNSYNRLRLQCSVPGGVDLGTSFITPRISAFKGVKVDPSLVLVVVMVKPRAWEAEHVCLCYSRPFREHCTFSVLTMLSLKGCDNSLAFSLHRTYCLRVLRGSVTKALNQVQRQSWRPRSSMKSNHCPQNHVDDVAETRFLAFARCHWNETVS